jgi:hypothetical protein
MKKNTTSKPHKLGPLGKVALKAPHINLLMTIDD